MEKRVVEVKMKALEAIEKRLSENPNPQDIQILCGCINLIGEDRNAFNKMLVDSLGKGFNGNAPKLDKPIGLS